MKRFFAISESARFLIEGYIILAAMYSVGVSMVAYPVWAIFYYDLPMWASAPDKADNSASITLYARPEREGSRNFVATSVDGKAGYLRLFTTAADGVSVTEASRHDVLQAPKMTNKEEGGEMIRNWPTGNGLIVGSRVKSDWAEDRPNEHGIKVPTQFTRIEITLEARFGRYDPLTIFATDYDHPEKLIKKDMIVLDFPSALALYEFSQAGMGFNVSVEVPGQ